MKPNGIDQLISIVMKAVRTDYAHNVEELEKEVSTLWDKVYDLQNEVKDLRYEIQAILSEIHGTGRVNQSRNTGSHE